MSTRLAYSEECIDQVQVNAFTARLHSNFSGWRGGWRQVAVSNPYVRSGFRTLIRARTSIIFGKLAFKSIIVNDLRL